MPVDCTKDYAILSLYDKSGAILLGKFFAETLGLNVIASGGTAKALKAAAVAVSEVSDITGFPEILNGRVKTLHPLIHGGVLSREKNIDDEQEMNEHKIPKIRFVVCNLYPFEKAASDYNDLRDDASGSDLELAIEHIDIGGVTLLRAAAKNYEKVTVLCDPSDYTDVMEEMLECSEKPQTTTHETRLALALKAFSLTARYDAAIADFFRRVHGGCHIPLKYGMNPHQTPAQLYTTASTMPIAVLNGKPGMVNVCDALNAWQLVRELNTALGMPAAASFKHVSPAGAAVGHPLSPAEAKVCMVTDKDSLSPLATAYARARGCDRLSSFGDFIALSDICDEATALLIKREVSDGVIAPGFSSEALKLLKAKKNGGYIILSVDKDYEPDEMETRAIFGLKLEQKRNKVPISESLFTSVQPMTSKDPELPQNAVRDLIVATTALKYTQSNSVVYAKNGQTIGIGAGQQSRIHCAKLAGDKADNWWLRQHPTILALQYKKTTKRPECANLVDALVTGEHPSPSLETEFESWWSSCLETKPEILSKADRQKWISQMDQVVMSSDGFFPFPDCVERAYLSGVKYIASPGGSNNDEAVVTACDQRGIVLLHTGLRLFHH